MFSAIRLIWSRRGILLRTSFLEIRSRYAGSLLGLSWVFLGPILLMAIYAAVYLVIFRVRPADLEPFQYVLFIMSGLVSFLGFNEALQAGTGSLNAHREALLGTVFPPELIPVRAVLNSSLTMVVGLAVIAAVAIVTGQGSWTLLLVPVVVLLQLMFCIGATWMLALANLILRDIQQVLNYLAMLLMIGSPIAYTPAMIPSSIRSIIYLNPLSYFVISLQELILFGRLPPWEIVAGALTLGIGFFSLGYVVFRKAKAALLDLV